MRLESTVPPEERNYYRQAWGFDPVTDAFPGQGIWHALWFYEATFPLEGDGFLRDAGVSVVARVAFDGQTLGWANNALVFRGDSAESWVGCLHPALLAAPVP